MAEGCAFVRGGCSAMHVCGRSWMAEAIQPYWRGSLAGWAAASAHFTEDPAGSAVGGTEAQRELVGCKQTLEPFRVIEGNKSKIELRDARAGIRVASARCSRPGSSRRAAAPIQRAGGSRDLNVQPAVCVSSEHVRLSARAGGAGGRSRQLGVVFGDRWAAMVGEPVRALWARAGVDHPDAGVRARAHAPRRPRAGGALRRVDS